MNTNFEIYRTEQSHGSLWSSVSPYQNLSLAFISLVIHLENSHWIDKQR